MLILDTDICIEWFAENAKVREEIEGAPGEVRTTAITAAELYTGAALGKRPSSEVDAFLGWVIPLPVDRRVAETYGRLRADLGRRSLKPLDLLIASTAICHKATLVSHDGGFAALDAELRIVDWLAE